MAKPKATLVNRVTNILINYPKTRNNDQSLMCHVWYHEAKGHYLKDAKQVNLMDFFMDFSDKKFSSPESIRRIRQKIQESTPSLQGINRARRKAHAETIRTKINSQGNHEIKYSI